jgi:GT2 family glycosyltransferase
MTNPTFQNSKTAFVVIAWNSGTYIKKCVESVLSLECRALDLFVVDNGSTDETPRILDEIAKEDTRLHVITEPKNLGTTISRNEALRKIAPETDYVCILDSDTVVNQVAFERMAEVLSDERIGVVGPTMMNSAGEEQLSGRVLPTLGLKLKKAVPFGKVSERAHATEKHVTPIQNGLQDVGYLLSACWLMRKSTLDEVGLLDEKIFYAPEDVDWCLRCHKAGYRVVLCHDAHIIHEYQRLSRKKLLSKSNFEHIKGLVHYFRKHSYFFRPPSIDK